MADTARSGCWWWLCCLHQINNQHDTFGKCMLSKPLDVQNGACIAMRNYYRFVCLLVCKPRRHWIAKHMQTKWVNMSDGKKKKRKQYKTTEHRVWINNNYIPKWSFLCGAAAWAIRKKWPTWQDSVKLIPTAALATIPGTAVWPHQTHIIVALLSMPDGIRTFVLGPCPESTGTSTATATHRHIKSYSQKCQMGNKIKCA